MVDPSNGQPTGDAGAEPATEAGAGDLEVVVSAVAGAHEVRLQGELDLATADRLSAELGQLVEGGARRITVDLSDLAFIDSTGLSVLIGALKRLRLQGGDMDLRSPTPTTRKVLEIAGLTEIFSIS